jgi:hypothetical protein
VAASATCDVSCLVPADCTSFGPCFTCDGGWCRFAQGRACVPGDEQVPTFSGYAEQEIVVDDGTGACGTGVCLVNHFQGRVSCPYGQTADQALTDPQCALRDGSGAVSVAVTPQLLGRRADDAVYCSCRCDGPLGSANFCACRDGFVCTPLVGGSNPLAGSYCVKDGTVWYDDVAADLCDRSLANCE